MVLKNTKILAIFIVLLFIATAQSVYAQKNTEQKIATQENHDIESLNIGGTAFIVGFVLNPEEVGISIFRRIEAKAVVLAYHEPGVLRMNRNMGVALYKKIQFVEGNLFYMSEPNQFGLVFVAGRVTRFSV
jgi:hypothetical protein